jgi:putative Ca2+/H+ antiporter (TMEM165/GDT1 family)
MASSFFEILTSSTGLVAASEMGDKTQLLAFSLAARFKRPLPVLAGILVATVLNHALAAGVGVSVAAWVIPRWSSDWLRIGLALLFFIFALWTLKPDTLDEDEANRSSRWGAFITTCILFFLAEMGDKTQLATVALGARFQSLLAVTLGTTLGMMLADGLAVFAGQNFSHRLPMHWIRRGAAVLFALFGISLLL